MRRIALLSTLFLSTTAQHVMAADFDTYGGAAEELVAPVATENFIFEFEIGGGGEYAPAYEGASKYEWGVMPIIGIDRLRIPGIIDIGGDSEPGLSFSPAFAMIGARSSADHVELLGLKNIDATYALGGRIGYDVALTDGIVAGAYGELLYSFGGSQGLLGKIGAEVTAKLTPELEITGGISTDYANENYMDTYFGVSAAEAAASGGRYKAYDASAGFKSFSVDLSARYEFIEDTFLNVNASYTRLLGSAADSPVSIADNDGQFVFGLGLSRKFGVSY